MLVEFYKIHGNGNDFIIINAFRYSFSEPAMQHSAQTLCQRKLGIGADGIIFLQPSQHADFEMCYFNADGSYAGMCGNGARCAVWVAQQEKIISRQCEFISNQITYYGEIFAPQAVRIRFPNIPEVRLHFPEPNLYYVHTGTPHIVKLVHSLDDPSFLAESQRLRNHPSLENGANVNWVLLENEHQLQIRTFEKGVEAETLACGTGCSAAAWVAQHITSHSEWNCQTRCGIIQVECLAKNFWLSGKITPVFNGYFNLEDTS